MIIPIRCFTCRRPVAHLWEPFNELLKSGKESGEALTELGLNPKIYCCRTVLLTHIDLIDELLKYSNNPGEQALNEKKMALKIFETEPVEKNKKSKKIVNLESVKEVEEENQEDNVEDVESVEEVEEDEENQEENVEDEENQEEGEEDEENQEENEEEQEEDQESDVEDDNVEEE